MKNKNELQIIKDWPKAKIEKGIEELKRRAMELKNIDWNAVQSTMQNFRDETNNLERGYTLKLDSIGGWLRSKGFILPETFDDFIMWYFNTKYPKLNAWDKFPQITDIDLKEYHQFKEPQLDDIFGGDTLKAPKNNIDEVVKAIYSSIFRSEFEKTLFDLKLINNTRKWIGQKQQLAFSLDYLIDKKIMRQVRRDSPIKNRIEIKKFFEVRYDIVLGDSFKKNKIKEDSTIKLTIDNLFFHSRF